MTVTIGLKQHIGNPATPIVAQNDRVARGQLIGVCDNLGANIHASCVGRVIEICQKFIKIEMDEEQFEDFVKIKQTDNYLESVREAGIVGCGGAGFPAHVKFATNLDGGVFILNAAECEPIFAHNLRVLEDAPELILRGMGYAMEMTNARTAYIALKPKHTK
ncbi:MAG: proline reductase-associated electron transfer protein PrdC, partial [Defluviitaleaceae bacterium]|nr:proline reductase-associated electron transfer protein PrdC [Defluviitaleaceae bacterium]